MKPLPQLQLSLQFGDVPSMARHRKALPRHWVARCIRNALQCDAEITVRIVNEQEGQNLNKSYRKKNYPTNVLTFDYEHQPKVIVDLVLCAPVIAKEAKDQHKTLRDHYAHLLVHGTLHAQGWVHETSLADAHAMEALEIKILARLQIKLKLGIGVR